ICRPLRHTRGGAAVRGDRRRRQVAPRSGRGDGRDRDASRDPAVAHVRSSRLHRRRGGTLSQSDAGRPGTGTLTVLARKITDDHLLTSADRALVEAALSARECAHAPWSHFKVGAAAKFGNRVVKGCNVEFDVYGLTNCAERTAVFAAYACGAARQPLTA